MADQIPDFEIVVQYEKNKAHPELVFESISKLITSFQKIDSMSARIINQEIKLGFTLEGVENGSVRVKLARLLKLVDDKDLEDLNYKHVVGKFLNNCRKKAILLLEKPITTKIISETEKSILEEAEKIADKGKILESIPRNEFLYAVKEVSEAVNTLNEGDSIFFVQDSEKIEMSPSGSVFQLETDEFEIQGTHKRSERMILKIKKADFLGQSKWEFKYDEITIKAKVTDEKWLDSFHAKVVTVGPGDALRVIWEYEVDRLKNGKIVTRDFNITKVLEIIPGEYKEEQQSLF